MISTARIRTLARQDEVTAGLAEKHYVNSWVLHAIYTSPVKDALVFKGGTALGKIYFPDLWRFSEDLDFTATRPIPEVEGVLSAALADVESASGISFDVPNVHQAGEPVEYVQMEVQYDAVLGQKNTTALDITFDEPLVFPVVDHQHTFEDVPEFHLRAYSIEEIFVEKVRSLFQRARARDYYDVYRLLEQESFDDGDIVTALREKADVRDIEVDLAQGLPEEDLEAVRSYWSGPLTRLVTDELPFDAVVDRIDAYLRGLVDCKG